MSLINKMLQDLDARANLKATPASPLPKSYVHLVASNTTSHPGKKPSSFVPASALVFLAAALLAVAVWYHYGAKPEVAVAIPSPAPDAVTPVTSAPSVATPPPRPEQAAAEITPTKAKLQPQVRSARAAPPATTTPQQDVSTPDAFTLSTRTLSPQERAQDSYAQGLRLWRNKDLAGARQQFTLALSQDPLHHDAREAVAQVMLQQGEWTSAFSVLRTGLTLAPDHGPYAFMLARLYIEQKNITQALAVLAPATTAAPPDAELLGLLAWCYQQTQQHQPAVEAYKKALALKPSEARWWLGLGIAYEALGDSGAAIAAYQQAAADLNADQQLRNYAHQRLAALQH